MKNKTIRFLVSSLIIICLLCVADFFFLVRYMRSTNENTIQEIGHLYMKGLNERISLQFMNFIDLHLSYVQNVSDRVPPESVTSYEQMCSDLIYKADGIDFKHMALYSVNGNFEMIYGEPVELIDPQPFLDSMNNSEKKVAIGRSASGESIIIMGVPASYTMLDGEKCSALTVGLSAKYIENILTLDTGIPGPDDSYLAFTHVIRRDGSFIFKGENIPEDNFFDMLNNIYKQDNDRSASTYIEKLSLAMKQCEELSIEYDVNGERRHLYCTPLDDSEWFILTVMPFGTLGNMMNEQSGRLFYMVLICCGIILLLLIIIFLVYFSLSKKQIKDLENAIVRAEQATKAKSDFLSNMSHDIRTPMNAIVGMTAIAMTNINNRSQLQNCLKKISLSSKHLLGLINDVLDMSKIESGKMTLNMEQISLREVMDNIVGIVRPQIKAKKQVFDISIHDIETEEVYCDAVRLNQLLLNLLSNAIKFTPNGGSINISLYENESPKGNNFARVHICVKDNGIGMSPEFKEKIFESFAREDSLRIHKTEGTGLGMAIVKFIVDAMGGTIELETEQGKGTEFHVTLDLEKAVVREADMFLPNRQMLLVDDDEHLCESAAHSLKELGIDVDWTLDGESAMDMVRERHEKHNDYQIILLDWKLPGINGIETARLICEYLDSDIPIILISAYDWVDIEEKARDSKIRGFISKPLFKSTLYHGLKPFIDSTEEQQDNKEESIDFNNKHILLAEDNDLNWEIAEALLSEHGLVLDRAENGKICVEKFVQSKEGSYDAVLMDLRMPVMDGYEATRNIRALPRSDSNLPIIAMTADAFSEDRQKCLTAGMNAHVSKPIDVDEILRLLEQYMSE